MFLAPLLTRGHDLALLRNGRNGSVVAEHVEFAGDSKSRRKGLLGRDRMEPGHALIIAPCGGIHMFGMRFAIDVLFVKRDGRVVRAVHSIRPFRIALSLFAYAAIELPEGTIRRTNTKIGDRLEITAQETAESRVTPSF